MFVCYFRTCYTAIYLILLVAPLLSKLPHDDSNASLRHCSTLRITAEDLSPGPSMPSYTITGRARPRSRAIN